MSDNDQGDKTEEPTGKRLTDAFERGQFARSQDLQVVCVLGGAFAALSFTVATSAREVSDFTVSTFSQIGRIKLQLDTVPSTFIEVFLLSGRIVLPIIVGCVVGGILASGVQSGFQLTPKAMDLKLEKLNPMPGLMRMFSKATFVQGGIDMLKLVVMSLVLWSVVKSLSKDPMFTAPVEAAYLGTYIQRATFAFLSRMLLGLGAISAISYAYERYKTHHELMMTREEVKEEGKQMEGNQQSKAAMKRMARRLLQKQMLSAVPTADVVITNPTHFAVALKYERGVDKAPVIVAKGENGFAQRIKALAAEHEVPLVENKPVARALFAWGKVGESIPSELYQAVAQILAFVYRTHRYYFYRLRSRRAEALAPSQDRLAEAPLS